MTSRIVKGGILAVAIAVVTPLTAHAHVTVSPSAAVAGERINFSISAPNEKDISFNKIRLVIPDSLESVTPTIAAGWKITTEKDGERTTSVTWSGNSVPAGQRAEFSVRTQVPTGVEKLEWKAYQTYTDGTEVAWDQLEESGGHGGDDDKKAGPGSMTTISAEATEQAGNVSSADAASQTAPLVVSLLALITAVFAFVRGNKK